MLSPGAALDRAIRAAILRAVESPLRVLADDEVVLSREAARAWVASRERDGLVDPSPSADLYDELAPQLTPPRPPVEVGQKRRASSGDVHEVTAVGRGRVLVVDPHGEEWIWAIVEVERWEVVDDE